MTAIGVILMAASAYMLIISIATDAIPAKWPFEPKGREQYPETFRLHLYAWIAAGAVGTLLAVGSLI